MIKTQTEIIKTAAEIGQSACKDKGHKWGPILVGFKARIVCKRCGQVQTAKKKAVVK